VHPSELLSDDDLAVLSTRFERATAEEIVAWAADTFGRRLCITASMTDAVLVDLASRVAPGIEVVFIDTGHHFAETLETARAVADRYPIRLRVASAGLAADERWRTDPDGCCRARKVVPMERALAGRDAWMSGLRRADSPERGATPIVQRDKRGLVKVNPLASWTDEMVECYVAIHDVPVNPLVLEGYPSIGCAPCTQRPTDPSDPRSGRWVGTTKTECGLHF
jgi:phosphoadenosine phosphosulfate reductase